MSTMDPPAPPPERAEPKRGIVFRLSEAVDRFMRKTFFRLGFWVARNPLKTILASLVVVGLCLIGMLRFRTESRAEELWVPQGTVALDNQVYVEENYGRTLRVSGIAFVEQDGGIPLASKKAFDLMLDVAEEGYYVVADPIFNEDGADGTPITYEERCDVTFDKAGNKLCRIVSAFDIFYDETKAVTREGNTPGQDDFVNFFETVRRSIEDLSDDDIRRTLQNSLNTETERYDGSPFNAEEIIGGEPGSGGSFNIKVLRYTQFTQNNAIVENGELVDKEATDLEERWTELLLDETKLLDGRVVDWFVESEFSQEDSLEQALSGDLPLLSFGFVLLGIYVALFLGDFHAVRSHRLLAFGALANAGLALGACFGLSSAFGMFFGPVHQILPLLVIGIGIDDCFHITRAADEVNLRPESAGKSLPLRVAIALSRSGAAITVTSFTNVVVFLLSAISKLPALRFFALWAAIGIFAAWAFAITFYAALLTLDMRRIDAKRRDILPCCPPVKEVNPLNRFKKPPGGFSRFFGNTFGPFIMKPVVRIILLVLFTAGFAACCYGTSQLYLKFKFAFFYPDGSDQREFQDVIDEYFELGPRTNVYVRDVDLSLEANQKKLFKLCDRETGVIANNEWIQKDTVDCWYTAFLDSKELGNGEVAPPGTFAADVKEFTQGNSPGARYAANIVFNDDNTRVVGCRFGAQYIYLDSNEEEIDSLESVREAADSVGFGLASDGNPAAFPYIFFDTFSEQYAALPGEIGLSLGLASAAVAIVCLVLVGHPIVALISVLVVGIIIIDVLGLTYFADVQLNSVSVITLVLCTGISVDFVVHIARSFLENVGTRTERAIKSLEVMGPPVFYAGFSTFLAIVVLAFASSYIFQVIFKGFLFLIIMGFLHGLILGPVILSLIGPGSFYLDEEDKQAKEDELEDLAAGRHHSEEQVVERKLESGTEGDESSV